MIAMVHTHGSSPGSKSNPGGAPRDGSKGGKSGKSSKSDGGAKGGKKG